MPVCQKKTGMKIQGNECMACWLGGDAKSRRAEEQKSGVPRRKRGQQTKTAGAVASSDSGTSPLPGTCYKATCTCSVSKDSAIAFHSIVGQAIHFVAYFCLETVLLP